MPLHSDALALAVLALLFERPMHPYEISSTLRFRRKEDSIKINYGSLYAVVESLEKKGLIEATHRIRDGRRPERTVYALTPAGEGALQDWLAELFAAPTRQFTDFEAALSLMPALPPETVRGLLAQRLAALEKETAEYDRERRENPDLPRIFVVEAEYRAGLRDAETGFVRYQVGRERRDGSALLPMHLFGNHGYSAGLVTQAVFQGSMVGFFLILTIYVQTGLGFSAIDAGLALVPYSIGALLGTGISVPLGVKLGKAVMFVRAVVQAASVWWVVQLIHARGADLSGWDLAPALVLGGVGLGLLVVPLVDIALSTVPQPDAGAASGAYGTFQQVGAATGVGVVGVCRRLRTVRRLDPVTAITGRGACSRRARACTRCRRRIDLPTTWGLTAVIGDRLAAVSPS